VSWHGLLSAAQRLNGAAERRFKFDHVFEHLNLHFWPFRFWLTLFFGPFCRSPTLFFSEMEALDTRSDSGFCHQIEKSRTEENWAVPSCSS
jgi:hypothetical protein